MANKREEIINYKKLGSIIRKKREEYNLTQEQLAKKAGISIKHLSNIEISNVKSVGLKTLVSIAKALDTSLDYLLMDTFEDNEDVINKEILKTSDKMIRK